MSGELGSFASSSFWEGDQEAVETDNVVAVDMQNTSIVGPEQEKEREMGVYRSLKSSKAVAIVDGCVASCFLSHVFKIFIINRP